MYDDFFKLIHVSFYQYNSQGIVISYTLDGDKNEYTYAVTADDAPEALDHIGNTVEEKLSQHDAIRMIASHLNEKKVSRVKRITHHTDLAGYANNLNKLPHS